MRAYTRSDAETIAAMLGVRVDASQLAKGMNVEREHEDVTWGDPVLTAKIALAHMREHPKYYDYLERMEQSFASEDDAPAGRYVPIRPVRQDKLEELGLPYREGGEYIDPRTREVLTNRVYSGGFIDTTGAYARFEGFLPYAKMPSLSRGKVTTSKVNLYRSGGPRWSWVYGERPVAMLNGYQIIVSHADHKYGHTYALRVEFQTPMLLATYPEQPDEPRLRPTAHKREVLFGAQVGIIRVGDKQHPLYDVIVLR